MNKVALFVSFLTLISLNAKAGEMSLYEDFSYSLGSEYSYQQNFLKTKSYQVATHYWSSPNNSKLFITAHGYLDNCLYLQKLHKIMLVGGYDILCYDLPGHGISSGSRADIDNFYSYKDAAKAVIDNRPTGYSKVSFMAHSTGAVGVTQLLLDPKWTSPFDHVFLISPLVRSYLWGLSAWAYGTPLPNFIERLPTVRPKLNAEYQRIYDNDPFSVTSIPVNWFGELVKWNESLEKKNSLNNSQKISVIFGEKDTVIDMGYSRGVYLKKFPQIEYRLIEGAGHVPYYDKKKIVRGSFFRSFFMMLDR
jgi:lysophospholipase